MDHDSNQPWQTVRRAESLTEPGEPVGHGESFEEFYRRELAGQVRRAVLILGNDTAANDVVHAPSPPCLLAGNQ